MRLRCTNCYEIYESPGEICACEAGSHDKIAIDDLPFSADQAKAAATSPKSLSRP